MCSELMVEYVAFKKVGKISSICLPIRPINVDIFIEPIVVLIRAMLT